MSVAVRYFGSSGDVLTAYTNQQVSRTTIQNEYLVVKSFFETFCGDEGN